MLSFGGIAFLNPWILAGLAALPVLWWLLRAIPPSPKLQVFAGVRLLLGLEDEERQTHKTPWWLLLIRVLAIAAALLGLAKPVLNLSERIGPGDGLLLLVLDQGWASAPDWMRGWLRRTPFSTRLSSRGVRFCSGAPAMAEIWRRCRPGPPDPCSDRLSRAHGA